MRTIIQQLEDLKEWAQNPERYERRLAFRSILPSTEAGTIPPEFDELSDREVEYYKTGPWSTREDYSKGQLVQPGPGRQGYDGNQIYNPQWYKAQKKLDLQRVTNPDPKAYQEMEKIMDDLLIESDIKGTKVKHLPQDITIQQLRNKVTTPGYKRSAVSNELFKKILNEKKGITYDNYRARKIATVLNEALEKSGGNILSIKPSVAVKLLPEFKVKGVQTKGGQGGNILKTYKNYLTGSARLANRAGIPIPETFGKKPLNTILTELETNFLDILGGRARGSFDVLNEVKLLDRLANENPKASAFKLKELYEQAGGTQFKARLKSLYPSKSGSLVRTQDKLILEAVKEGSVSNSMPDSIREAYRVFAKEINMSRFMAQAEKYRKSNPELAYRYTKAFNMVQNKNMKRLGITGAGEHALPLAAINTANAAEDTYFKIDGYIDHELNNWKRVNFDEPIFKKKGLADKYHKATGTEKKAIQSEIIQRLEFMKKRAPELMENVTFDFTGGKFTANSSTIPIDQLDDAGFKNLFTKGNRINQKFITDMPDAVKLTSTGRIASIDDKFIKPKIIPKATKLPPSYGVGSTFAGVADDFLKTKTGKAIGKGIRKGARFLASDWVWPEIAIAGLEYKNRKQKGQSHERALSETLKLASLGFYDQGGTEKSIIKQAKMLGYEENDIQALDNFMKIHKLDKEIQKKIRLIDAMELGAVEQGDYGTAAEMERIQVGEEGGAQSLRAEVAEMKKMKESLIGFYFGALDRAGKDSSYGNEIFSKSLKSLSDTEFNASLEDRMKQADPYAGGIGSWLNTNVFTLHALERQALQERIDAMNPEELREFNIERGVLPIGPTYDAYDPRKMEGLYETMGYMYPKAEGGIVGIRRPWAIPPESGPDSQGLAYLNNYATKRTE